MNRIGLLVVTLSFLLAACGGGGHDSHSDPSGHAGGSQHEGEVPGSPASASEADRRVEVVASDDLSFDPALIEVDPGDVVTFVVRNEGRTEHEFVLGDADYQTMHEEEMRGSDGHSEGTENAVTVAPGSTATLTWRFSETGDVLYGCHVAGHYDGGMVGTVEVG